MTDNNKLHDTILDMEASLSTNFRGYSVWHYGAYIHGITRETLKNAVEALKAQEPVKPYYEKTIKLYICGQCGAAIGVKGLAKYCINCGQAVKWDG